MEIPLLKDVVVIFGLSLGVILVCHRFKIPPIIGFLLTGVMAGPHGLGLVGAVHEVEVLAEIGVILLLFVIGMELSFKELIRLKKPVFLGGGSQVLMTIIVIDALALLLGSHHGKSVFFGFLVALSSTAIVLKLLSERAEMNTPHGRISLGILIFQDIVVVPMMLLVPFLSGTSGQLSTSLLLLGAKTLFIIAVLWVLAKKVVPWVLLMVVRTRSRELFLMTTLAMCFSIALLTSSVGLSLSLGAFMAGLIISESEYSLSALEGVLPFRDVLTSLFFVSIGMLLDLGYVAGHLWTISLATMSILSIKAILVTVAGMLLGFPLRVAVLTGLALCQIGEFSFVLAGVGQSVGLMGPPEYQLFLAVAILTMSLTPFMIMAAPRISNALAGLMPRAGEPLDSSLAGEGHEDIEDHLIIVGFGIGGRHLARTAKLAGIPYRILEMNPDTVRSEASKGEPIFYGDATMPAVLEQAGVAKARILAAVIADPAAVGRIVEVARAANPSLNIIVRTRFVSEIEPLRAAGANHVVPEEFETSIEIFTRVLAGFLVPIKEIERFVSEIRSENYGILCNPDAEEGQACLTDDLLSGHEVAAIIIDPGAALDGKTLQEAGLRGTHGLTLVGVRRAQKTIANPEAGFRLQAGDTAYVFGEHRTILAKRHLFKQAKHTPRNHSS